MVDFVKIGGDGLPYTDFSSLTPEQAAAISEFHVEVVPEHAESDEADALTLSRNEETFTVASNPCRICLVYSRIGDGGLR